MLQFHLAALASLKGDIVDLNKRLQQTERERDLLEKKLAKAQVSYYPTIIIQLYYSNGRGSIPQAFKPIKRIVVASKASNVTFHR